MLPLLVRRAAPVALVVALALAFAPAASAQATCATVAVPVSLGPDRPQDQRMAGRLCRPAGERARVVLLLVHGFTYDAGLWDQPGFGGRYSFARAMHRAGYATLAVDRLGVRRSSRPPGRELTLAAQAHALGQVARWLRRDAPGGRFARVAVAGHSLGTVISRAVAAQSPDVAALVATGFTHALNLPADFAPCLLGGVRAGDADVVTLRPGCRRRLFYARGAADPRVVADDERRVRTGVGPEAAAVVGSDRDADGFARRVALPVLLAVGSRDRLFCGTRDCSSAAALRRQEAPLWPRAELAAYVLPGAGHTLSHHIGAPAFFSATVAWLRREIPARR
jgi:pimeloyl-ACP methyl ester carboxylesterase